MKKIFEEIFKRNYSPLCNYATAIIKDEHAAKDLVQGVFLSLWETNRLVNVEKPDAYILRCVKFKSIDFLKKQKKNKIDLLTELPDFTTETLTDLQEEDIIPLLHYFASKLPPKTRKVFLMSRQDGLSYKAIAEDLGVSTKTVENQIGFALKKMRLLVRDYNLLGTLFLLLTDFS